MHPQLEYAASVWDPYTEINKKKIEMVQRRAARYVNNDYQPTSSVSNMLQNLGWPSLQDRRKVRRLVLFFKIHNGLAAIDTNRYLKPMNRESRHTHEMSYKVPPSKTDYHMYSFFPRTIRAWNSLSLPLIETKYVEYFKTNIEELYF